MNTALQNIQCFLYAMKEDKSHQKRMYAFFFDSDHILLRA